MAREVRRRRWALVLGGLAFAAALLLRPLVPVAAGAFSALGAFALGFALDLGPGLLASFLAAGIALYGAPAWPLSLAVSLLATVGGAVVRRRVLDLDFENRALALIAAVGEATARLEDAGALLDAAVRAAVERAGYPFALIVGECGEGPFGVRALAAEQGYFIFTDDRGLEGHRDGKKAVVSGTPEALAATFAGPALEGRPAVRRFGRRERDDLERLLRLQRSRAGAAVPVPYQGLRCLLILGAREPGAFGPGELGALAETGRMLGQGLERLRLLREIAELSFTDPLTGILNRRGFFERGARLLDYVRSVAGRAAFVYIDLNRFKEINDRYGHALGDEVLRQVAERLHEAVRARDLVARLGGDEFAALLEIRDGQALEGFLSRILRSITRPYAVGGSRFYLDASLGVALFPADGERLEELLRKADAAMYRAKRAGKRVAFAGAVGDEAMARRFALERELAEAIASGAIEVVYQPVLRHPGGEVVFWEALARWKEPPEVFVPLAEELGLAWELDRLVLTKVLDRLEAWQAYGRPLISVNLSPRSLASGELVAFLERELGRRALPPGSLALELPEQPFGEQRRGELLRRLWEMGVRLVIDDFGTGLVSLAEIKDLPFDFIELPGSLVRELGESVGAEAVAEAIRALGERAGVAVVAEGVETRAELDRLLRLGYGLFKGHYFGKPMPAEEAERLLAGGAA